MRIVSLAPAATEILCLLGGRGLLVGRSHACTFPTDASLGELPVLTRPCADPHGDAPESGERVRTPTPAAGPLYRLNEPLLLGLRPDLILVEGAGGVRSSGLDDAGSLTERLPGRPRVVSLATATVEDMLDDVLTIGREAGLEREARRAALELRARLWRAQEHVNAYADGPVVGFLVGTDPLLVAGDWIAQLIERAGGRHPLNPCAPRPGAGTGSGLQAGARVAGPTLPVSEERFAASDPERLVIAPRGLDLALARREAERLARRPWWGSLPAVRRRRVALVDGAAMFNRPGPRLVDAFEWLVGWLDERPSLTPEGFPWEPLGA